VSESQQACWDRQYLEGETPWDSDEPEPLLIETVRDWPIPTGRALDIGCGTGSDAIWLATSGFTVTGVDISRVAIERAEAKSVCAGCTSCRWLAVDFLAQPVPGRPFDFIFDRGCYHTFEDRDARAAFADAAAEHVTPGGWWLSVIASAEAPRRDGAPLGQTVAEIAAAVEGRFRIQSIRLIERKTNIQGLPALLLWGCLFEAR